MLCTTEACGLSRSTGRHRGPSTCSQNRDVAAFEFPSRETGHIHLPINSNGATSIQASGHLDYNADFKLCICFEYRKKGYCVKPCSIINFAFTTARYVLLVQQSAPQ